MDEQIVANVGKHITLNPDEKKYFLSLLRHQSIPKGDHQLKAGQICRDLCFVNSGVLRAYFVDEKNKESTIMFAVTDWWITDMHCFLNQKPAMLSIEAIQNSSVLCMSKPAMDTLLTNVPSFEKFFRIIMQNAYVREQLRVIQNLSLPAEVRYKNFLKNYPQIAPHVTQKQIASYLGITPEFLSTIRAKK